MNECLICGNPVYPMVEVDIKVGIITSNEPPICQDCYEENPEELDKILERWNKDELPF